MAEYDVIDEAIIDADTATAYNTFLDEVRGLTDWWKPYWESKLRGDIPVGEVGAVVDITVRHAGTTRFTAKVTEMIENQLIKVDFIEGEFLGDGEWTFEPVDGKTKVRFHWQVRANSLPIKLVDLFMDIGKLHSEVIQAGYKGMNEYLESMKVPA
jgi:ribosome-associated toxin RatA of RatAB toxin-antitoxin module